MPRRIKHIYLIVVEGGDSSGKSETVETPQGAQRPRRLDLARGKRPPETEINRIGYQNLFFTRNTGFMAFKIYILSYLLKKVC